MGKYLPVSQWKPTNGFTMIEEAERIIKETQQNLSILAGPGTGKTEILAQRANFLLQTGTCKFPQKILALSFKVDAATNIRDRVELRCGKELAHRFNSSTFDAFFISIARRFSTFLPDWIGMRSDFEVSPSGNRITEKSPLSLYDKKLSSNDVEIWKDCAAKKVVNYHMCRAMAFTIVEQSPQVKNLIRATYAYLFLDELQDTTNSQYQFIKTIFKDTDTLITAVGDKNQMIMEWAGASSRNFENLKNDFNSSKIFLTINHRSNDKIIALINYIIKDLTTCGEEPITYTGTRTAPPPSNCLGAKVFNDADGEAQYISKYIGHLMFHDPTLMPSDFALILRQKAKKYFNLSQEIFQENGLRLRNEDEIVVDEGIKIQDLMSEPLFVFWTLLIKKKEALLDNKQKKELEKITFSLTGYNPDVDRDRKKLSDYILELVSLIHIKDQPIDKIIDSIIDKIGKNKIELRFPEYKGQYLEKVKNSLCCLFQKSIENHPADIKQAIETYEGVNQVKLMTIHKSKGLEFNTVFFVDFNSHSWWSLDNAIKDKHQSKQREEKNAFFVGLSRAKERLFFTKKQEDVWAPVIKKILDDSELLVEMPSIDDLDNIKKGNYIPVAPIEEVRG